MIGVGVQGNTYGANDGGQALAELYRVDPLPVGLVTYSIPIIRLRPSFRPFLNSEFGQDMAQNGAFGGTPDVIHNGLDTVAWTASDISGNSTTFNSTDVFQAGTNSVRIDNPSLGDTWQFDKGSYLDVSTHTAITMYVYVDKDWDSEAVSVYCWDTAIGEIIGAKVFLNSYINTGQFDVWQKATIPFSALGIDATNFDAIRMALESDGEGKNPKFYLDTIQVEETGEPVEFRIVSLEGEAYQLTELRIGLANNVTGGIDYDSMLGVSATNGITISYVEDGITVFAITLNSLADWMDGGFNLVNHVDDSSKTYITLSASVGDERPYVIQGDPAKNYWSMTINDDMSGLDRFFMRGRGGIVIPSTERISVAT